MPHPSGSTGRGHLNGWHVHTAHFLGCLAATELVVLGTLYSRHCLEHGHR